MTKEAERFTLRLTGELKNQLDESRKRIGISLNALVVQILWSWVKENRLGSQVSEQATQQQSEPAGKLGRGEELTD